MNQNLIKFCLLICFVTSLSISKAQFWQPAPTAASPAPFFNGGFGALPPLPTTLLRVNDGSVLFDGNNGATPVLGFGRRLMWIPELAAFRAGGVSGTAWDIIGQHSFAGGYDTRADGNYSTAFGSGNEALGLSSFAIGNFSTASGDYSTAIGSNAVASNLNSTAIGYNAVSSGNQSFSMGSFTNAAGANAFSFGHNNTSGGQGAMTFGAFASATGDHSIAIGTAKATSAFTNPIPFSLWASFDCDSPTLFVGPGSGPGTFGDVGIGTSNPQAPLHVFAHSSSAAIFIPDGAVGTNPSIYLSDPFGYPGITLNRNGNRGDVRYSGDGLEFTAGVGSGSQSVMLRLTNGNQLELYNGRYVTVALAGGGTTGASINNNGELIRTPSDSRLKEGVVELDNNLEKIKLLRPVSYSYIDKDQYGAGRTIGFIAQEVEKVLPEVVKKSDDEFQLRSLNYVEIIPVLTGALQEQEKTIEKQNEQIEVLLERLEVLEQHFGAIKNQDKAPDANSKAYLKQNVPNPSAQNTIIKFFVPTTAVTAKINFYDMTGKEIKTVDATVRGEESSVNITAGEFISGMYMYSLLVDGKEIDTKKMIISQ